MIVMSLISKSASTALLASLKKNNPNDFILFASLDVASFNAAVSHFPAVLSNSIDVSSAIPSSAPNGFVAPVAK